MKKFPEQVVAFGLIIKKIRLGKNISQQELAWRAEMERRTLIKIENGQIASSLNTILSLAEALEMNASDLLAELEKKSNRKKN